MEQLALAIPATCCCSLRALGHATSRAGALPGRDGFALPGIGEVMGLTDQEPTTVDCSPTKVGCSPTKVGIEIFPAGNRQLSAGDFPPSQCLITRGYSWTIYDLFKLSFCACVWEYLAGNECRLPLWVAAWHFEFTSTSQTRSANYLQKSALKCNTVFSFFPWSSNQLHLMKTRLYLNIS